MSKDIPIRIKYRTVLKYGVLKRGRKNNFTFVAHPWGHSPVLKMEHRSRWAIVDEVYAAIKSYG